MARFQLTKKMFEDDRFCMNCARWYIPPVIDDDGYCEACKKVKKHASKRIQFNLKMLKDMYDEMARGYRPEDSYIYFVLGQTTRRVKIGYTSRNVRDRLCDLQTGSPDRLILLGVIHAPFYFEAELHHALRPFHSHGEWYDLPSSIVKWIQRISRVPIRDIQDE